MGDEWGWNKREINPQGLLSKFGLWNLAGIQKLRPRQRNKQYQPVNKQTHRTADNLDKKDKMYSDDKFINNRYQIQHNACINFYKTSVFPNSQEWSSHCRKYFSSRLILNQINFLSRNITTCDKQKMHSTDGDVPQAALSTEEGKTCLLTNTLMRRANKQQMLLSVCKGSRTPGTRQEPL